MEVSTEQLKALFNQDIIDLYKRMIKLVKHKPTRLMDYINKYGGYEAAVKYISTESNVQDFAVLWEKERLDLSVEALITKQPYRVLFDDAILKFCDKKLADYSYAPNKIKEVEEPSDYVEKKKGKIDIDTLLKEKEYYLQKEAKKRDYELYNQNSPITIEQWKEILLNTKVVTANNLNLLLCIYSIGDEVGPKEISKEDGYSSTYPYREVITALAKRIKSKLHLEVPIDKDGKTIFWHILFNGGYKDNNSFEWSLRNNLRLAINELIAEGKVTEVAVRSKTNLKTIEESAKRPEPPKKEEKAPSQTAFDKLFESIMAPTFTEEEKPKIEEKVMPKIEEDLKLENTVERSQEDVIQPKIEALSTEEKIESYTEESPKINTELNVEKHETVEAIPTQKIEEINETPQKVADDYKARLKQECIEYYGAICDLCGFDFGYTYGEEYANYIEVYNIHDVNGQITETTNPTEDLIPICCNCSHVIRSQTPPIPVEQMRKMIKI